jgi:uncharacterized protein (TIGR00661 family)
VGPLLRREVLDQAPSRGEHLLVYMNSGRHLFSRRIEQALLGLDVPVMVYGTGRSGHRGNLRYRPRGNREFVEALATCRAVICTAGNQLVGEGIHFRKPLLVMPEDSVEQRVNARAVERMGIGMQIRRDRLSVATIRGFLLTENRYRRNLDRFARNGLGETLEAFGAFFAEVAGRAEARREAGGSPAFSMS